MALAVGNDERFLDAAPRPTIAALAVGVAGPVIDGRSTTTNLPWHIDERVLAAAVPVPRVRLVNDLEAAAHGMLALAEEDFLTLQAGRPQDAIPRYQAVLAKDPNNVAALDGLALILVASGSNDGAIVAADRVLAQRPKDPDALFVKGLALYGKQDWNGAVDVWTVYLDVGQYHFGSEMVRGLYADARAKAGR